MRTIVVYLFVIMLALYANSATFWQLSDTHYDPEYLVNLVLSSCVGFFVVLTFLPYASV